MGTSWELSGASWEPLGSLSGASWRPLGSLVGAFGASIAPRAPKRRPRGAQEAPKRRPRGVQEAPRGAQEAPERAPRASKRPPRGLFGSPLEQIISQIIDCKINVVFYTVFDTIFYFFLLILYCILVWFTDPLPIAITFFARRCDMRFVSYFTSRKACRSLREQHENIKKTQTNIRKTSSQNTRCADTHKYHIFSRILVDLASTLKPKSIKIQPQTRPKANLTPKSTLQRRS